MSSLQLANTVPRMHVKGLRKLSACALRLPDGHRVRPFPGGQQARRTEDSRCFWNCPVLAFRDMQVWKLTVQDTKKNPRGDSVWQASLYVSPESLPADVLQQILGMYAPGSNVSSLDFRPSNSADPGSEPSVLLADMIRSLHNSCPSPFLSPNVANRTCLLYIKHTPQTLAISHPASGPAKDVKKGRAQSRGKATRLGQNTGAQLSKDGSGSLRQIAPILLQRAVEQPHTYLSWEAQPDWVRRAVLTTMVQTCPAEGFKEEQFKECIKK